MKRRGLVHRRYWVSVVSLVANHATSAGDDQRAPGVALLPQYKQECAGCHAAFPPGMLPARSWQRVMNGLERHYGTDASLDAATVQQLSAWLQAHAGTYKRVSEEPPQDRITRSAWFERKHRKVEPAVWHLPSVKSAANCAACHTDADQGRFDDDKLRMPDGLTLRQRWAWVD